MICLVGNMVLIFWDQAALYRDLVTHCGSSSVAANTVGCGVSLKGYGG